jgi:hypothetical protein
VRGRPGALLFLARFGFHDLILTHCMMEVEICSAGLVEGCAFLGPDGLDLPAQIPPKNAPRIANTAERDRPMWRNLAHAICR